MSHKTTFLTMSHKTTFFRLCKPAMQVGSPEIFTSQIVRQTQYVVVAKHSLCLHQFRSSEKEYRC